jgi:hypothetical protein
VTALERVRGKVDFFHRLERVSSQTLRFARSSSFVRCLETQDPDDLVRSG